MTVSDCSKQEHPNGWLLSEKCDIFSLGVIMWEHCTLNRPWKSVPPERLLGRTGRSAKLRGDTLTASSLSAETFCLD
ncbi:hypothetical protein ES332_A12G106000v1 [Gossypium tomentosum]|uniref:Serine-threonine/tyrosine-protein kinase catalytic domain-containing protein n=1 Tax=Gossypium tomentosum TaxID=34277 RepID=A0A5D2MWF5_GOSTO|nr:hypothetical protein ES332_A12G106000v1 [Gossypium tomentosum]